MPTCSSQSALSSSELGPCASSTTTSCSGVRLTSSAREIEDLPAVGAAAAAVDATGPPRWREDVHRLLREATDPDRPSHGRIAPRRAVRRRARREQLHLRRGDRHPAVARGRPPGQRKHRGISATACSVRLFETAFQVATVERIIARVSSTRRSRFTAHSVGPGPPASIR